MNSLKCASPVFIQQSKRDMSCTRSGKHQNNTSLQSRILTHLEEKEALRTHLRLSHLRTLLMRCCIAQSTARELERKQWAHQSASPSYHYYDKMLKIAFEARKLANALGSRELQARCEYWAGRGCGGTHDWHAAAEHFALARELDVPDDRGLDGEKRLRGLKPREKDDVEFLEEYSKRCRKRWLEKMTPESRIIAEEEAERTEKSMEEVFDWSLIKSPIWQPDRHRVVQATNREAAVARRQRRAKCSDEIERMRMGQPEDKKLEKEEALARGIQELNNDEIYYIRYGDKQARKQQDRFRRAHLDHTSEKCLQVPGRQSTPSPSSSGFSESSEDLPTEIQPTLQDELERVGMDNKLPSSPSLPESFFSPAPLNQRRKLHLTPISIEKTQEEGELGRAVHASLLSNEAPPLPQREAKKATVKVVSAKISPLCRTPRFPSNPFKLPKSKSCTSTPTSAARLTFSPF